MALTGIADVDMKILQELNDDEIYKVCSVNKYVSKLCNNDNFWLNRLLLNKYYDSEELREIKGDFTYKEIYRYLTIDFELGALKAAEKNNVYLLNAIKIKHSVYLFRDILISEAAKNESFDILTSLFLDELDEDKRTNLVDLIYFTDNEKSIEWIFKNNLSTYESFIGFLIHNNYNDYTQKQLKKYIPRMKPLTGDDFAFELGESLEMYDLESREKIFDLFLSSKKIVDIKNSVGLAIEGMESKDINEKERKGWIKFLSNKIK